MNVPSLKIGLVAVSRDCFPESLSVNRRKRLVKDFNEKYESSLLYECPICIVESEIHMRQALDDIKEHGCNALVVYLGNFGPEISETLLAKYFDGPIMFIAASEENIESLLDDRGDAYCGLLNASYNLKLRNIKAYIPENPVGNSKECAKLINDFVPIARAIIGLKRLKVISFGPRPTNFLACNAPIKQLFNLDIEIEENSELDLFESFLKHAGDERIESVVLNMQNELGLKNAPAIFIKLAQYELTLLDWIENHKGERDFIAIAGKCWPAFQTQFGFVPCYVNSRLTGRGIPVSCEVDIYGAISEYIGVCISNNQGVTLLDINNTVPNDLYDSEIKNNFDYKNSDVFMGFHCGNTCSKFLCSPTIKNQKIMARSLPKEVTHGTLEGDIVPGNITFYRLQSTADNHLVSYVAQGEVLPVSTHSFGSIGIFAIKEMGRFYRHCLIEKAFPHHGAVLFGHYGKELFEVFKHLGVEYIGYNKPANDKYDTENPF